ncbi:MAG TPA: ATP-binding cassette domain-containing protein [Gemmatimonadales bacterium]|nr:ATP-binding cassette domain-containing protein [Gemmatimonadales bacterium]
MPPYRHDSRLSRSLPRAGQLSLAAPPTYAISTHHPTDEGTVGRLPDENVAFLNQHGAALNPELSVLDNFRALHQLMDPTATRHALARFLYSHEAALQRVKTLSGGQRLRASFACVLGGARPPSLLVLDEPTNHLDVDALEVISAPNVQQRTGGRAGAAHASLIS